MEEMINRIRQAAQAPDDSEIQRIVHELVVIGACDMDRARSILERA